MSKSCILRHRVYKALQESICDCMINDVAQYQMRFKKNSRVLVNVITKNVIAKLKSEGFIK